MRAWQRYWFEPTPYLDLAIVRIIAVATTLIVLLYTRNWHLQQALISDEYWDPILILNLIHLPFGWDFQPPVEVVEAVYFTAVIAGALSLLGVATNVSLLIFAAASVYVQAFIYSFGDYHHREAVMMIMLSALALSPSGRVLSIDSLITRRGRVNLLEDKSEFAGWPLKLIGWFFVLMYLSAVREKLSTGGLDWPNGFTLQFTLARDGLRHGSALGVWLSHFHLPVMAMQFAVLAFQASFAIVMIFPKARWLYVPVGLMLHIGIFVLMRAPFYQWIALYAVFVPWTLGLKWLLARRTRPRDIGERGQSAQVGQEMRLIDSKARTR